MLVSVNPVLSFTKQLIAIFIMLKFFVLRILSALLVLPFLCNAVADPNPFAAEDDFDIFYGLPGSQYGYGRMGAAQTSQAYMVNGNDNSYKSFLDPTDLTLEANPGVVTSAPTTASAPEVEAEMGVMNAVTVATGAYSRYPQEFYCPQDNNAKFST